jgi:hypothetical protein
MISGVDKTKKKRWNEELLRMLLLLWKTKELLLKNKRQRMLRQLLTRLTSHHLVMNSKKEFLRLLSDKAP